MNLATKILLGFIAVYVAVTVMLVCFGIFKNQPNQDDYSIETKLNMMTKNDVSGEGSDSPFEQNQSAGDYKRLESQLHDLQEQIQTLTTEKNELTARFRKSAEVAKAPAKKNITQEYERVNPFFLLGAYPDISYVYEKAPTYDTPHSGLINDDNYCHKVDLYNLAHPENMFKQKNFFTDYPKYTLPRKQVMSKIGNIAMDQIYKGMKQSDFNSRKYNLSLNINNFFSNYNGNFDRYHKIGQHFLCATQMYNHIPGHTALIRKDAILDSLDAYAQKYQDKPQCFHKHMYFPPYFRLYDKEECKAFFAMLKSDEYKTSLQKEPIQYLVKVGRGSHKGQGVFLLDQTEADALNKQYRNGKKCGKVTRSLIAQAYITNPLLLDMNNKFDFRLYVLIASTNPLVVYYHDGFLRVALSPFNKASDDKATHLTNTFLANQKIEDAKNAGKKLNGMTEAQLKEYHLWSFDRLQKYLLESGKITDPKWLDNYLRPAFQKAINHIIKMTSGGFLKLSNLYELQGLDFILDDQMNLWFIESNPSPLLTGTTKHMIYHEVVMDMFEVQYAYYRSRMQRLVKLINKMSKEAAGNKEIDLQKWREEYEDAVRNRLEPQHKISKKNSWKLIMDENKTGADAYFGLIQPECVLAN